MKIQFCLHNLLASRAGPLAVTKRATRKSARLVQPMESICKLMRAAPATHPAAPAGAAGADWAGSICKSATRAAAAAALKRRAARNRFRPR